MKIFTFKRSLFSNTHLPRKKVYNLSYPNMEEYFWCVNKLEQIVIDWVNREKIYDQNKLQPTLLANIEKCNLKILANPDKDWQVLLTKLLQDSEIDFSTNRLIDLHIRICSIFTQNFIEVYTGNIWASVSDLGTGVSDLPSNEDWYILSEKYKFIWLFFLIQDILRSDHTKKSLFMLE